MATNRSASVFAEVNQRNLSHAADKHANERMHPGLEARE